MARKEYDEIRIAHFDGNLQTRMDSSRFFRIKRKSVLAAATGVGSKRALYFIEIYQPRKYFEKALQFISVSIMKPSD